MALKTVRLYWHALGDFYFRPDRGGVPRSCMSLRRGDLALVEFHAATANDFVPNSDGTVPASYRHSLAEYTGTPVLAIKTESKFAADGDFEEAWSGFYASSLAAGTFKIAVAPSSTFDPDELHRVAIQLRDADLNPMEPASLALDVGRNLYLGTEGNAPVGITSPLSGSATISSGDSVSVTIPGLTAAGVVIVSLLGTSSAFTTLAATCATNLLTIQSAAPVSAGGSYVVAYRVVSL